MTTKTLSDWDQQIVNEMNADIELLTAMLAAGPNVGDLYRPKIGDARAQTAAHWEGEIVKLQGWIANIIANA